MTKILGLILILVVSGFSQVITPVNQTPDAVVTTGGVLDYFTHQAASFSSVSFKMGTVFDRPAFSTTTLMFTPQKQSDGSIKANGVTIKSGFTYLPFCKGIVCVVVNSEAGITKFDFATLGNFDGSLGISFDIGQYVTKGKAHIYLVPFFKEVNITSLQIKPTYGLQIGTGFSR